MEKYNNRHEPDKRLKKYNSPHETDKRFLPVGKSFISPGDVSEGVHPHSYDYRQPILNNKPELIHDGLVNVRRSIKEIGAEDKIRLDHDGMLTVKLSMMIPSGIWEGVFLKATLTYDKSEDGPDWDIHSQFPHSHAYDKLCLLSCFPKTAHPSWWAGEREEYDNDIFKYKSSTFTVAQQICDALTFCIVDDDTEDNFYNPYRGKKVIEYMLDSRMRSYVNVTEEERKAFNVPASKNEAKIRFYYKYNDVIEEKGDELTIGDLFRYDKGLSLIAQHEKPSEFELFLPVRLIRKYVPFCMKGFEEKPFRGIFSDEVGPARGLPSPRIKKKKDEWAIADANEGIIKFKSKRAMKESNLFKEYTLQIPSETPRPSERFYKGSQLNISANVWIFYLEQDDPQVNDPVYQKLWIKCFADLSRFFRLPIQKEILLAKDTNDIIMKSLLMNMSCSDWLPTDCFIDLLLNSVNFYKIICSKSVMFENRSSHVIGLLQNTGFCDKKVVCDLGFLLPILGSHVDSITDLEKMYIGMINEYLFRAIKRETDCPAFKSVWEAIDHFPIGFEVMINQIAMIDFIVKRNPSTRKHVAYDNLRKNLKEIHDKATPKEKLGLFISSFDGLTLNKPSTDYSTPRVIREFNVSTAEGFKHRCAICSKLFYTQEKLELHSSRNDIIGSHRECRVKDKEETKSALDLFRAIERNNPTPLPKLTPIVDSVVNNITT